MEKNLNKFIMANFKKENFIRFNCGGKRSMAIGGRKV